MPEAVIHEALVQQVRRLRAAHGTLPRHGEVQSAHPDVRFLWATEAARQEGTALRSGVEIILSGRKTLRFGSRTVTLGPGTFMVVGRPVAFPCEIGPQGDDPLFGVSVEIDAPRMARLARAATPPDAPCAETGDPAMSVSREAPTSEMRDAVRRLVDYVLTPERAEALADGAVDELAYFAIESPQGGALRAGTGSGSKTSRLRETLVWLHESLDRRPGVEEMAAHAGMSATQFFEAFREETGESPASYVRRQRLERARTMVEGGGIAISEIAERLGFAGVSQFSRDFKALFGTPPSRHRARS